MRNLSEEDYKTRHYEFWKDDPYEYTGTYDKEYRIKKGDFTISIDWGQGDFIGLLSYEGNDKEVKIPDNLGINYIGNDAFSYNLELESVEIPDGVCNINSEAFSECENLKTVIFPQTLETIGYQAFDYCFSIKEFSFPENLTYIGDEAFAQCDSLENINFGNNFKTSNVVYMNSLFFNTHRKSWK